MANVRELRDLGDDDLLERLDSSKEELFNLRFQLATGQLDNPMRIKQVRQEIARVLTILRERDIARELEGFEEQGSSREAVAPGVGFAQRRRLRKKEESQ